LPCGDSLTDVLLLVSVGTTSSFTVVYGISQEVSSADRNITTVATLCCSGADDRW
jgi:hypothetical protein